VERLLLVKDLLAEMLEVMRFHLLAQEAGALQRLAEMVIQGVARVETGSLILRTPLAEVVAEDVWQLQTAGPAAAGLAVSGHPETQTVLPGQ
jgi:hypothetical protein